MAFSQEDAGARYREEEISKIDVKAGAKASWPRSGERRLGFDRRQFDYTGCIPERRKRRRDRRNNGNG
jgi:hypothetical protein